MSGIKTWHHCPKAKSLWKDWGDDGGFVERLGDYDDRSPLILPEAKECIKRLASGYTDSNPAISAGNFFIQQILLIDFLAEVCLPFYEPGEKSSHISQELPEIIYALKKEASDNRGMIMNACNCRGDFLEAVRVGRDLLAAQAKFWSALHRQLLAAES
jgi:hypothetical protein